MAKAHSKPKRATKRKAELATWYCNNCKVPTPHELHADRRPCTVCGYTRTIEEMKADDDQIAEFRWLWKALDEEGRREVFNATINMRTKSQLKVLPGGLRPIVA